MKPNFRWATEVRSVLHHHGGEIRRILVKNPNFEYLSSKEFSWRLFQRVTIVKRMFSIAFQYHLTFPTKKNWSWFFLSFVIDGRRYDISVWLLTCCHGQWPLNDSNFIKLGKKRRIFSPSEKVIVAKILRKGVFLAWGILASFKFFTPKR